MSIFIIKPVGLACDLRCTYCFYEGIKDEPCATRERMDEETVQAVIKEITAHSGKVAEFNWLGGEPLLAGLDFYEHVVALQQQHKQPGQVVINKVQTNGSHLDDAWATFFAGHRFNVGVSVDGPAHLHDRFRHTANGQSVHARIEQGIQSLRRAGVHFGTICVVNSYNVSNPDELFSYFLGLGVKNFSFNDAKGLSETDGQPLVTTVQPDAFARFMCRIFDLWAERDDPTIIIRQIRTVMQALLGGKFQLCTFSNRCHDFYDINIEGDVYPCEDYTRDTRFCYGNIRNGLDAIKNSAQHEQFTLLTEELRRDCQTCPWWNICHGGCIRDYYIYHNQAVHRNAMCDAHKTFFRHVATYLGRHVALPAVYRQ